MTEIKYKDLIIPVEAGQAITLSTTGKKLTDNIEMIFPKVETVEEWDGSHTISGGVELIDFTISGAPYQTEAGMTWIEWCNSSYNTEGYRADGGTVTNASGSMYVTYNGFTISPTEIIIADGAYSEQSSGGAG